jgi:hypothetical protein
MKYRFCDGTAWFTVIVEDPKEIEQEAQIPWYKRRRYSEPKKTSPFCTAHNLLTLDEFFEMDPGAFSRKCVITESERVVNWLLSNGHKLPESHPLFGAVIIHVNMEPSLLKGKTIH